MNILGQLEAELVKQQLEEGMHKVVLNVGVLPSGIQFYRLEYRDICLARKQLLIK